MCQMLTYTDVVHNMEHASSTSEITRMKEIAFNILHTKIQNLTFHVQFTVYNLHYVFYILQNMLLYIMYIVYHAKCIMYNIQSIR